MFSCANSSSITKMVANKAQRHIFLGYRMNIKKGDANSYSLLLTGKEYVKERTLRKYSDDKLFDTPEQAIENNTCITID